MGFDFISSLSLPFSFYLECIPKIYLETLDFILSNSRHVKHFIYEIVLITCFISCPHLTIMKGNRIYKRIKMRRTARFIPYSSPCTTTELSKLLNPCLTTIKKTYY